MSRTKQGGSVLGFAIIGVVMVLLLIGGVYAVRHYWAPSTEVAKVSGPSTTSSDDTANNSNQKQSSDSGNNTNTPPQTTAPAQPPVASVPAPAAPAAPVPTKLPTTGPADTVLSMVVLGIMTAATAAYVQSLRHRTAL